jgi:hypothetical protein
MSPSVLIIIAAVAVAVAALLVIGSSRWSRRVDDWRRRMAREVTTPTRTRFREEELAGLPPVVQAYFRRVLAEGAPVVVSAELRHRGTFNMGEDVDRWAAFESRQWVETARAGFVWDARVALPLWLSVHVLDAYVAGFGALLPSIAGIYTLEDLHNDGDLGRGELLRWFAEAAWYPTALLPSQGVRWLPIDARSARASFADGKHLVSLTFVFTADGLIESVHTDARPRLVRGQSVPTAWEGRWTRYERRDGMLVPTEGEVAWLLPSGRKPYWRARLVSARYTMVASSRDPERRTPT